jgi:hypothetical protein
LAGVVMGQPPERGRIYVKALPRPFLFMFRVAVVENAIPKGWLIFYSCPDFLPTNKGVIDMNNNKLFVLSFLIIAIVATSAYVIVTFYL